MRRLVSTLVTVGVGLAAAGCTAGTLDKAGGAGGVLTLRLATPDFRGAASSKDVMHFAERVRSLSDGRMRIEVTWEVALDEPSWDQKTAQLVMDGDHDMGFVPARAWDVLGVTSLQPLQAPFLVTSDTALDTVVVDPVAEELMAGLETVGVTGLVLVPEGLRHPVGYGAPLVEPGDFAGTVIRSPRSEVTWQTLRALGADPRDVSGESQAALFDAGRLAGAESSAAYAGTLPYPGVMTANLTPYAKANSLIVNTDVLDELTDNQRDVLQRAALDTRDHNVETRQSDADALATACSSGLRVVLATAEQQAAMRAATEPVHEALESDSETGPILARVAEIVEDADPPAAVKGCGAASPENPAEPQELDLTALDGVWRFEVTYQDGLDAGLPEDRATEELGVQTVRMDSGTFEWSWRSVSGEQSCDGTYRAEGGLVVFSEGPPCGGRWEATPLLNEDEIAWTAVRTRAVADPVDLTLRELLHSVPWRKVEDLTEVIAFPEAVYRWEVSEDELIAAGIDEGTAYHNSGLMTFTVEDGRWLHHTSSEAEPPDCGGTYQVTGSRIAFTTDGGPDCGGSDVLFSAGWSETDDGIQLDGIEPANPFSEAVWGAPWRRIS